MHASDTVGAQRRNLSLFLGKVHRGRVGITYNGVKFICKGYLSAVPSGEPLVNNKPIILPKKMALILKFKIAR